MDERDPATRTGARGASAGGYSHLYVKDVRASPLGLLEEPDAFYDRGKSLVLQCSCRTLGCAALLARVGFDDTSVTWTDFERVSAARTDLRAWGYEQLGPFRFARAAYAAAFEPCAAYGQSRSG